MADKPWKRAERNIASVINGKRVPITGRARGDAPDIDHDWLSVEVKYTSSGKIPKYLKTAREQSEKSAQPNQLPVQVFVEKGMNSRDAFLVMRLGDFIDWFGD